MKEELATRLKEARIAAGFKRAQEAAEALHQKYQTYAAHENANRLFGVEDAILYARKFRVSLDWLLTGRGKGPGGADVDGNISGETAILSMLARIEGFSESDVSVAFAVIKNALDAKRGARAPSGPRDQLQPANLHHE